MSGLVECICSGFRLWRPRCVSVQLKSVGYILGFPPWNNYAAHQRLFFLKWMTVFILMHPPISDKTMWRPRPYKTTQAFLCTDWLEIWRGVVSWQRSVYKYELSILTLGGKKLKIRTTAWEECWSQCWNYLTVTLWISFCIDLLNTHICIYMCL